MGYVARFVVDDEVGPRGCQLHEVRGDVAVISWFVPLPGREYPSYFQQGRPLPGQARSYREAQEVRHEVPVSALHETLEQARAAAVARKAEVQACR
jgi:hypothetical protein